MTSSPPSTDDGTATVVPTRPRAEPVAITGMGAVTALGEGVSQLMNRWLEGECGIDSGEARCATFRATDFMSPRTARRSDRFAQLALAATRAALDGAGWREPRYPPDRIGCVIGTAFGGIATLESYYDEIQRGTRESPSPETLPIMLPNAAIAAIVIEHDFMGPTFPVGSTCAAGADAIALAVRMIQAGAADAVVAGAAEAPFARFVVDGLGSMRALSSAGISRPFDAQRDGFVLGEGAAIVVLEGRRAAENRGAPVLGEILGAGLANDSHHITQPAPDGRGVAMAMRLAMAEAGISGEDVVYVNAHGTSTPLNDRVETLGIKAALGAHAQAIPVSSTKSAIGHLLGAAGAIDLVATVEALRRGLAPPTLGYVHPEPGLDLDYVPGLARALQRPDSTSGRLVALSNSAGFGGHNTSLCVSVSPRGE